MVFGAMFSALSGVNSFSSAISMISDNVANNATVGYKRRDAEFTTIVTNANSTTTYSSGGVQVLTRRMVDRGGTTQTTGNPTDMAINGAGMFVVNSQTDGTGEFKYTRSASFRQDEKGNFVNAAGMTLMAWQLDNEGRLPGDPGNLDTKSSALLTSLVPVNFKSVSGSAVGTTLVNVGITLDAQARYIKGAGEILSLPRGSQSLNDGINGDALIIPSDISGAGRIQLGDIIAIKTTPPGIEVQYEYGGVAITNDITAGSGILGANTKSLKFTGATNGDSFRISFGSSNATFRYKNTTAPNASRGEFNTLETLAEAINSVPGLKARIESNRLHIGTIKGTDAINFTELSGSFVSALGLVDIPAATRRFSTINGLKDIMNKTEGLEAVLSPGGGIDFYTELPTSTMKVHGITARNRVAAANATVTNAAVQNERVVTITSAAHGLNIGDYVRIEGFTSNNGATLADGIYMVTAIPNANTFTVNSTTSASGVGAATTTDFTWVKAPGISYSSNTLVSPNITATTGPDTLTIAHAGHTLALNDVIYISGYNSAVPGVDAELPDGYYTVTAVTAGVDFTITPKVVNTAGGPTALGHNLTYRKVGIGTPSALDTTPISLTTGSTTVRVYMPNHNMTANQIFTFKNVPGTPPISVSNVVFDNEQTFIIQTVGTDATYGEYFEYNADNASTATTIVSSGELTGVVVNEYTRLFKELNLSELDFDFGPSYNAAGGDAGKNLSEGTLTDNSVYVRPLAIYDSLGVQHNFRLAFAKLDNNKWAVEIYAAKLPDGSYDIELARPDGQIAAGTILFNGDGSLASVDTQLLNPVEIVWKNEAMNSNVRFNWGTAGVPQGTAGATVFGLQDGMRQVASEPDQRFLDQNGVQPGLLSGISVDKDGYLIASFSNGSTKPIFKIPIAQFTNYNGLLESTGNSYSETNLSGSFNLREAGSGGVGVITPQALEKSNAELADELTKLIFAQKSYQASAKVISVTKELLDTLDRNV
ncbi:MAG: flgE [Rickettsiaceae bacterium]|jgi:flagellar hook protein FlgE|nr:flgE [Rickettsiaceae bacterium]